MSLITKIFYNHDVLTDNMCCNTMNENIKIQYTEHDISVTQCADLNTQPITNNINLIH